jgi:ankyrin repeat protein
MNGKLLSLLVLLTLSALSNALPTSTQLEKQLANQAAGANILWKRDDSNRDSQLLNAAFQGNDSKVAELISEGANVNYTGLHRETALMIAALANRIAIVQQLIKAKADVNAVDELGITPLMFAAFAGHTKIVDLFIAANANVSAVDRRGISVLMFAAEGHKHKVEISAKLINAGAQ